MKVPPGLGGLSSGVLLLASAALFGCEAVTREHLFSGRAVTQVAVTASGDSSARQSGEEISVQGWVVHGNTGQSISLTFSNQSSQVIPMSALVDEYTVKTDDGRVIQVKDLDFLAYPQKLGPGDERTVTLYLPDGLAPKAITQVVAKLNQGKTVVVLQSIGPKEPPAWRVGSTTGIVVSEQAKAMRMDAAPTESVAKPVVVESVAPVAPLSAAPTGTVPVNVSFNQTFGSTLRAEVYWNDQKERVTLKSGDSQLFYLVPGQHEFHAVSRLPFIVETYARVPVVATATAPIRIDISADAKLTGVELRVHVFNGGRSVIDQRFSPLSKH